MKPRMNQQGFTLLEMVAVVAMIGVLASIAIPNYQKFAARSRQAEAKVNLSAIYTVEESEFVEQSSFTNCLAAIGFKPLGKNRYYTVGFGPNSQASVPSHCPLLSTGAAGPTGCLSSDFAQWNSTSGGLGVDCWVASGYSYANDNGYQYFAATAGVSEALGVTSYLNIVPPNLNIGGTVTVTQDKYMAVAAGNISTIGIPDIWSIDQNKNLVNYQSGI